MKWLNLLLLISIAQCSFAQTKLPVVRATSKTVSINDGGFLDKNSWTLSPHARPDVYTADRTRKTKWVTFYTDVDSIRIKVKPGTRYNFVILLNSRDSCFTQVASAIPPKGQQIAGTTTEDTIPFTLTAYNAIGIKAFINDTATFNMHFDLSSFDFHFTKDVMTKRLKGVNVSKLQLGTMVWHNPHLFTSAVTAHEMDGRIGWNVFDGKTVEINYDKQLLIIRSQLPKLKGYKKVKIDFMRSLVGAKGTIIAANKKYTGEFIFDTGADQAVIIDSAVAQRQNLAGLKLLHTTVLRDPRGVKYETKTVLLPAVGLDKFSLANVPAMLLTGKNPSGFEVNYFGNDFLKRFNMVLDFKKDELYIKPNQLQNVSFRQGS